MVDTGENVTAEYSECGSVGGPDTNWKEGMLGVMGGNPLGVILSEGICVGW
jgi:hypothetical protein